MAKEKDWKHNNLQTFWGQIAANDHLVQVYDNDEVFLQSLVGYVGTGFIAGDIVISLAAATHRVELDKRLSYHGFDVKALIAKQHYIPLDAHEILASLMVNDWPDELLFNAVIPGVISKAKTKGRHIRAFGEMVALLCHVGNPQAAIRLEQLWNAYHAREDFCLFCAYPRSCFTSTDLGGIDQVCACHTKVIGGWNNSSTEIYYREMVRQKQA